MESQGRDVTGFEVVTFALRISIIMLAGKEDKKD